MASGPLVGGGGDGSRDKHRWAESKVYTRKSFHKSRNAASQSQPSSQTLTATEDGSSSHQQQQQQPPAPPPPQQLLLSRFDAAATSDDSSSLNRRPVSAASAPRDPPASNGFITRVDNRVKINLSSRSKQDLRELRRKLSHELDQVRSVVKRLEARELQLTSYSHSQVSANDAVDNGVGTALRGNSEVASATGPRPPPQLSISVLENTRGMGDVFEKEKRTPKANQYYRNSEFLLGKDRLPPDSSNKKLKTNGSKKFSSGDGDYYGMGVMDGNVSRAFKECGGLLSKLMKHKHGWVFNTPVDVKGLGLHDYYTIIKHPMDLGTVKSRLNKNWYKSPREFAEDVRLTFRNAMTYNPKGQDVHFMAEQLLKIFEERWAGIEAQSNLDDGLSVDHHLSPPTPHVTKKAPPAELRRTLDRSESSNLGVDSKQKAFSYTPTGRVAAPKKPKAKDPNKRDMTYEEKQKLSTNLMSLPPEKLDNIVQIIKKRNPSLSQNDDEIEVDIESFDAETLWELDRFVVNYKKSLSKNKKKAELANQARVEAATNNVQHVNPAPPVAVEVVKENKTDEKNDASSSPVEREKPGDNASRSSSSSSSSSDSGSSSSDSDSDSSSASDAPRSPRT
ncbi:hypothetical protein AAC387_Pa06g0769 [Persea americana]